jgi:hypothetical protein
MSAILAEAPSGIRPPSRTLTLTGLFWAFSYVLLSVRGALFHDDWSRLVDDNRLLTVTFGAGVYFLVLKQLEAGHRIALRGAIAWTVGATLGVMIVRLTVDQFMFDVPQGMEIHLLWSLTWSAYFAVWVMGSVAFATHADAPVTVASVTPPLLRQIEKPVSLDRFELMAAALIAEASELSTTDRAELAARVMLLGGYECADGLPHDNERARLALRLAARLSSAN